VHLEDATRILEQFELPVEKQKKPPAKESYQAELAKEPYLAVAAESLAQAI
jgi:hypothetical protein